MSWLSTMPSPPEDVVQHPGYDRNADQSGRILGAMIALIILGSTFIILRLTSRHLTRAGFWVSNIVPESKKKMA